MKKRFFSLLLCLCMVLALCPVTAFAEEPNADATELQNLLEKDFDAEVKLERDYNINSSMIVCNDVTLDLNGYVIRKDGSPDAVFKVVAGTLTLEDSRSEADHTGDDDDLPAGGVITSGMNGNAVYVYHGSFTMNGGNIYRCYGSPCGGGVDVDGGNFIMNGGAIDSCTAQNGGGVRIGGGAFIMNGGAIYNCDGLNGSGVYTNGGNFTINGGDIYDCSETNGKYTVYSLAQVFYANGGTIKGRTRLHNTSIQNTSDDGDCTVFYGQVKNEGTISSGVYYGGIVDDGGTIADTYHAVSFHLNGGSGSAPTQYFVDIDTAPALQPADPTKGDGTFTGWYTDEALTTLYDFDSSVTENITLYAGFTSAPYTVTASFSVTVETFDRGEPGETTFELETVNGRGEPVEFDGVKVTASVTTDGAGTYPSTMSISGSIEDLRDMLIEGVYVRQVNEGKANWNYDDGVWALFLKEGIVALDADDDAAPAYSILIFPTILEETENGEYYKIDWNGGPVKEMSFINTYAGNQAHIRVEDLSEPDESTKPAGGNSSSGDKSNPQTGDGNGLALCAALIAVSAAGMAAARLSGKRGKNGRAK